MSDQKLQKIISACSEAKPSRVLKPDVRCGLADIQPYNEDPVALAQEAGWQIDEFDFPEIWAETKGKGIKVAVLDTGVDISHPDLDIQRSLDFVGIRNTSWWDAGNNKVIAPDIDYGSYTPTHDHGTHVSGIIGARDNDIGMIGVAPECEIYALRVLNEAGSGYFTDMAVALLWCLYNEDIDVINMSIGGFYGDETFWNALKLVYDAGIPVIVSAGNEYFEPDYRGYLSFPAQYDESISVGAIDSDGDRAYFSSVGPNLDVMGPGVGILSSIIGGTYGSFSGTSMAAPFVAGLAALIIAKHRLLGGNSPVETVEDMREHITKFATDDESLTGRDIFTGWGIVEPNKSFSATREVPPPSAVPFGRLYAGSIISHNDKPWILR